MRAATALWQCPHCGTIPEADLERKQSAEHPAQYSVAVLAEFAKAIDRRDIVNVLDPMGGVGGVHKLARPPSLLDSGKVTTALDIECCYIAKAQELYPDCESVIGDACALPFDTDSFSAIAVSPSYMNRMRDWFVIGPNRTTKAGQSYALNLGRELDPRNSAHHEMSPEGYWRLHAVAWSESVRVLRPGGLFVLNAKDFVRGGIRQRIVDGHVAILTNLGLSVECRYTIAGKGYGSAVGEHGNARAEGEETVVLSAPLTALEPVA
jgi:hypothetical protein